MSSRSRLDPAQIEHVVHCSGHGVGFTCLGHLQKRTITKGRCLTSDNSWDPLSLHVSVEDVRCGREVSDCRSPCSWWAGYEPLREGLAGYAEHPRCPGIRQIPQLDDPLEWLGSLGAVEFVDESAGTV